MSDPQTPTFSVEHAAGAFVAEMMRDTFARWPVARDSLLVATPHTRAERPGLADDPETIWLIALTRIAVEAQALRRLAPELATPITMAAYRMAADVPGRGPRAIDYLAAFDSLWTRVEATGGNPMEVIGLRLFVALDLIEEPVVTGTDADGEEEGVLNPFVLMVLTSLPTLFGMGYWQRYLAGHQVEHRGP